MSTFDLEDNIIPKPHYEYINDKEELGRVLEEISHHPEVELDTETTGLDPYNSKVVLAQLGIPGKSFVFDVRHDTEFSSVHLKDLQSILVDNSIKKILQNAVFDMKMIKLHAGFYVENIYDTMIAEQLLHLGLIQSGFGLKDLVFKYLGLNMPKESAKTFQDYYQEFRPFQLDYAASDVSVLSLIKSLQAPKIKKHGLEKVCELEFNFTKPLCEMELNGILLDIEKWRKIMGVVDKERIEEADTIQSIISKTHGQQTLFNLPVININSTQQLLKALQDHGLDIRDTNVKTLKKFKKSYLIKHILNYRKASKLISTYSDSLINRINPTTGRLHTRFKQMVSTGRMSSSAPNLQNIPKKQKFRSCFIAKEGYSLVTADMSSAELRLLGNFSEDPIFMECFVNGIDLHSRSASEVFEVDINEVDKSMRNSCKSISFGLCYGMSKFGLAESLDISEKKAESLINSYFNVFGAVKTHLDESARNAIKQGYSSTISGRKRFYSIPSYGHPDRKRIQKSVERAAMNMPVQGCLTFDSRIKGLGNIGNQFNKQVEIETGFGKDTALGVYSGKKDVYELKLSNGIDLGITLEHKVPIVNKTSQVELCKNIAVEDLSANDLIMIPLNTVEGETTNLSGYKYKKKSQGKAIVDYSLPEKMDSKLAFIIGCLIGDGNYTDHNHFRFICPSNQFELFKKFNSYVSELFNYVPIEKLSHVNDSNREDLPHSQVFSVVIRGFLKYIGLDYVKHHSKIVPEYFYTETIENRGALLNGLFSTDGGFTIDSGPNYTTVSKDLANMIHQLLFSLGINSNLKTYSEVKGTVYRLQVPKRFNEKFKKYVGFSVDAKQRLLENHCSDPNSNDSSIVPEFIPKTIEKVFRKSNTYFDDFTVNEKAHLRRFKLGSCSYTSWRKFYKRLPQCEEKEQLSKYLKVDFCYRKDLVYLGKEDTYDLMCDNIHYFTANGVIVHNSNADTIKESMIIVVDRLEKSGLDAKLLLCVHDEIVVEVRDDQVEEAAKIVSNSLVDGFGKYFTKIPMEADALVGPCWLKDSCGNKVDGEECGGTEMKFVPDVKFGTKLVCAKCGENQE